MFLPTIKSKIVLVLAIISAALAILSAVLIIRIIPGFMKNEINKSVRLEKDTEQYSRFLELPIPLNFKVYFFNVENPDDIINGAKPVVKEVGPYIYKESRRKFVDSTDEKEDTISYVQSERFEFDSEASGNFSDEDYVTMLNAPMMGVLESAESFGQAGLISKCLKDIFPDFDTMFVTVKVKDILFDGIRFCVRHLSLCEIPRSLACKISSTKKNVDKIDDGSLKFSFFNYKAKDNDDLFTIKRGIEDVQTLGHIIRLNNLTYTNFWKRIGRNSKCDEVKGTDGSLFPPQISKKSVFQVYSTDICRYMEIRFVKEQVYKGVKGYMFGPDNSTLRSSTPKQRDDCFCAELTKGLDGENSCFLDGVVDIQPCIGVPALLSFPHFLWADKSYVEAVDGMSPNEEIHRTFVLVEPDTGTPLQAFNRIQLNVVLRPIAHVNQMEKVPRVVMPVLWVEEGDSLTDEYVDKLEELYFNKVKLGNIIKWSALGGSTVLTIIFAAYFSYKQCCNKSY